MNNSPLIITQVEGRALPIQGDDIDTDRIIPARYLKEITFDNMGNYLFYDVRYNDGQINTTSALNQVQYKEASIMVVGKNFGCGSSREHAPQAIKRAGFNAIIGESFAEIFSGNCKSLGLVTVTLKRQDLDQLGDLLLNHPSLTYVINIQKKTIKVEGVDKVFNVDMKASHQHAFLNGTWDELAMLKLNDRIIDKRASKLPYFNW